MKAPQAWSKTDAIPRRDEIVYAQTSATNFMHVPCINSRKLTKTLKDYSLRYIRLFYTRNSNLVMSALDELFKVSLQKLEVAIRH